MYKADENGKRVGGLIERYRPVPVDGQFNSVYKTELEPGYYVAWVRLFARPDGGNGQVIQVINTYLTITEKEVPVVEVTPEAPELIEAECGVELTVKIPEMEGVEYTQTRDGDLVTVTATAKEGYVIPENAPVEWIFSVAAEPCPVVPSVESLVFDPAVVTISAGELATGHLVGKIADWDSAAQKVMVGLKLGSNVVGEPVEATVDADGNFTVDFHDLGLTGGRYNANSPLYVATAEVVSLSSDEVLASGTANLRVVRAPAEVVSVEMTPADPECVADYPVTISGVVKGFSSAAAPDNNNSIRIRVYRDYGQLNQTIITSVDADGAFSYELPISSAGEYRVTVEFRGAWAEGTENQEYTLNIAEKCAPTKVTPLEPVLVPAAQCGVSSTVAIPEVEGLEYTFSRDGDTVTVTATAQEGYVIAPGFASHWTFDVAAKPCGSGIAG